MITICNWCGKKLSKEKIYLIDNPYTLPKVFCSQKCKWEYDVQIIIDSQKLPKTKNN